MQDQWLNIFLLNEIEFSYYQILYYLSGFLFPVLAIYNSLNNLSDYKFNNNKYQSRKIKYISYVVIFTILTLSLLILKYFLFTIKYLNPEIDISIYFDYKLEILTLLLIIIFLFIDKTKRIIKKLFLINFFIISFFNWTIYFLNLLEIEILIDKNIYNNSYFDFKNLNILNIIYLFIFEIFFYFWSFITNQNNLSDWSIPYPSRSDFRPIYKIIIFYLGILIYYFIFNRIN